MCAAVLAWAHRSSTGGLLSKAWNGRGVLRWLWLIWVCGMIMPVQADPLRLVVLGPPGAGKGTQAKLLAQHYQLNYLATGVMLRGHIRRDTTLGREAKPYVHAGELVPDRLMVEILEQALAESPQGFVLDGFPVTSTQAGALDRLLKEREASLTRAIQIDIPDEVVVGRLARRGTAEDTVPNIRLRLMRHRRSTGPILAHYRKQNRLLRVSGVGNIRDVQHRIRANLAINSTWFGSQ